MSKAILMSIRPEHLINILNGYKTLELRKNVPKDYKGWVYCYCTKGGGVLVDNTSWINFLIKGGFVKQDYTEGPRFHTLPKRWNYDFFGSIRNGEVVARFWFDEYDTYYWNEYQGQYRLISKDKERFVNAIMSYDELCLNEKQVNDYGNEKHLLYTWHIKHLEIFDKPMELSEFYFKGKIYYNFVELKRPPQSWRYVWVEEVNNE